MSLRAAEKNSKEPEDDVRPHGRHDKRKYHSTAALWQLCNTQKARKHYHNMIIIHLWDSGKTAVINYKITLTAHFSCNSDLFIKAFMTPYHTTQV